VGAIEKLNNETLAQRIKNKDYQNIKNWDVSNVTNMSTITPLTAMPASSIASTVS
jgi:hypothetical protein